MGEVGLAERIRKIQALLAKTPILLWYAGSPDGVLNARESSLCWDVTNQRLYANTSSVEGTAWTECTGGGGGGGGAPVDAQYLTLALNGTLTDERRFVLAGGASAVDGGANGDYTVTVHDAVTLASAEIQAILDLSTQALDLDTQTENTVLAGPASAPAAKPAFRALVAADIPAGLPYLAAVLEGPGIDVTGGDTVGLGGDTVLVYDSGGSPVAEYAATDGGLTSALAAMAAGDVCLLPDITISGGPWALANGVLRGHSRTGSILDGEVTMNDDTRIENLTIERSENDTSTYYGVEVAASSTVYLYDCIIKVTQNGAGTGYGVRVPADSSVGTSITDPGLVGCYVYGSSGDVLLS